MSHDESGPAEPGRELGVPQPSSEPLARRGPPQEAELADAPPDGAAPTPTQPLGLIDKYRLANLRSRKELEAVEIALDARITEMRHQADAASRESKAYWDAKSAEVVTAMKTFVQAQLRGIENDRMASRFDSITSAYELFATKVREIETGSLPDDLREGLIRKLRENLTETIGRLENDALADRYDLKD
jgi:hypothetical protein